MECGNEAQFGNEHPMKNGRNSWEDHDFWTHFWCGLIVGAGLGAWISFGAFDGGWASIAWTLGIAITFAYCCGRWGDSAWSLLMELFSWFW
jgi:hypothetical protein